jgi:hypothetical protein
VNTTLSAVALLLALGLTASAAEPKKLAVSQHRARDPSVPLLGARQQYPLGSAFSVQSVFVLRWPYQSGQPERCRTVG